MEESYFIGNWLGTPAHPSAHYILEITFQESNQVSFSISDRHIFDANWNFYRDTRLITLYSTSQNIPVETFNVENCNANSFDLIGGTKVKIAAYFARK